MPKVTTLYAEITARTEGLDRAVARSTSKIKRFGAAVNAAGRGLSSRLMSPIGITAVGAALAIATKKAVDFADTIDKTSIRTGLARDTLQEFAFVGDQLGVSFGALEQAIRGFGIQIPLIRGGTSEAAKEWKKLNIELEDGRGNLRSMDQLFPDIINALAALGNETEQLALAQKIFGSRGGVQLIPLLKAGSGEIDRLTDKARDLGLVMSNEGVAGLVKFKDKMAEVTAQAGGAFRASLIELAPVLTGTVIPAIQSIVTELGKFAKDLRGIITTIELLKQGKIGAALMNEFGGANNVPFLDMPTSMKKLRGAGAPGAATAAGGNITGGGTGTSTGRNVPDAGFGYMAWLRSAAATNPSANTKIQANLADLSMATEKTTLAMREIEAPAVQFAEATGLAFVGTNQFALALGSLAIDSIHDFSIRMGEAITNVVLFGDSLKDTLASLGKSAAGNIFGSIINMGVGLGLNALLPGLGGVLGAARGGAASGGGGGGGPSFGKNSQGGGSVGLSLGKLVVEENRGARRNGLHLTGLS